MREEDAENSGLRNLLMAPRLVQGTPGIPAWPDSLQGEVGKHAGLRAADPYPEVLGLGMRWGWVGETGPEDPEPQSRCAVGSVVLRTFALCVLAWCRGHPLGSCGSTLGGKK